MVVHKKKVQSIRALPWSTFPQSTPILVAGSEYHLVERETEKLQNSKLGDHLEEGKILIVGMLLTETYLLSLAITRGEFVNPISAA